MAYRAIGIDDSVNTCDCCGKTGLKSTVIMVDDNGVNEPVHFGSTCAQRNSGKDAKTIKKEIKTDLENRIYQAKFYYYKSFAYQELDRVMNVARDLKLSGKEFREYCNEAIELDEKVRQSFADDYGLQLIQLY